MSRLLFVLLILYVIPHLAARLLAKLNALIPYETFWASPRFQLADGTPTKMGKLVFALLNHFGLIAQPRENDEPRALDKPGDGRP